MHRCPPNPFRRCWEPLPVPSHSLLHSLQGMGGQAGKGRGLFFFPPPFFIFPRFYFPPTPVFISLLLSSSFFLDLFSLSSPPFFSPFLSLPPLSPLFSPLPPFSPFQVSSSSFPFSHFFTFFLILYLFFSFLHIFFSLGNSLSRSLSPQARLVSRCTSTCPTGR